MSYPELPEHPREGRLVSPEAADAALVRKPQIGDTRPAPIQPVVPGVEVDSRSLKKIVAGVVIVVVARVTIILVQNL